MEFKEKYLKYKMKYTDLKIKQNIFNFLGGACEKNKNFNYADLSSVLDYAKNRYECTEGFKTTKKYFVILYGPPASGKTISRKLASMYIKKHFNESLSTEEIYKSFIDTGVDDLVYDAYYNEESPIKSVKDKLKETIDLYFLNLQILPENRIEHIKTLSEFKKEVIEPNNNTYSKYRSEHNIDDLSALLGIIATYTNHNVFFEIASPNVDYINKLIQTLYWNKYKIVFIYPYTNNYDLLVERNYARGLLEGRIMDGEFIKKKAQACIDTYDSLIKKQDPKVKDEESKKAIQTMYDMYKNIMILRYNTDLTPGLYSEINNFTLNLDDEKWKKYYIYEFDIKIDGNDAYK